MIEYVINIIFYSWLIYAGYFLLLAYPINFIQRYGFKKFIIIVLEILIPILVSIYLFKNFCKLESLNHACNLMPMLSSNIFLIIVSYLLLMLVLYYKDVTMDYDYMLNDEKINRV